jgi:hypothetical protein
VIDALKEKGIAFDARGSKATLETLLTQTLADTPKEENSK